MPQVLLTRTLPRDGAEAAYALACSLFDDDAYPVAIREVDEQADIHEVSIYVDEDEADLALARLTAAGADGFAILPLPDIDWVRHSLDGLKPVSAGRFHVHGAHDRPKSLPGRIAIEIEAGLAFGTGHHGTTAGCLIMLSRRLAARKPRRVLDVGSGSGVLAIAVARLARTDVLATDIDPVATAVAHDNARLNKVGGLITTLTATGLSHPVIAARGPYDLIVANILARPLKRLAPAMARHLQPGGDLVLSGILASQRRQVMAAYATQRIRHVSTLERDGWVTLHMAR